MAASAHQRVAPVAARAHGQVAGLALGEESGDEVAVLGQQVRGVVGATIFLGGKTTIHICKTGYGHFVKDEKWVCGEARSAELLPGSELCDPKV